MIRKIAYWSTQFRMNIYNVGCFRFHETYSSWLGCTWATNAIYAGHTIYLRKLASLILKNDFKYIPVWPLYLNCYGRQNIKYTAKHYLVRGISTHTHKGKGEGRCNSRYALDRGACSSLCAMLASTERNAWLACGSFSAAYAATLLRSRSLL